MGEIVGWIVLQGMMYMYRGIAWTYIVKQSLPSLALRFDDGSNLPSSEYTVILVSIGFFYYNRVTTNTIHFILECEWLRDGVYPL